MAGETPGEAGVTQRGYWGDKHKLLWFGQVLLCGVSGRAGGARDVSQSERAGALELLHVPAPAEPRRAAAPAGLEHSPAGLLHQ